MQAKSALSPTFNPRKTMSGSSILDVAIGMIYIYLLFGVLCTAFNEMLASLVNKRGTNLLEGIKNLLNDPFYTGLASQIYNHGLVNGISRNAIDPNKPNRLPSYIPSSSFSLALVDILSTRGALAGARNALLTQAEQADDAYNLALAAQAPSYTPEQISALSLARDAAEKALQQQAEAANAALTSAQQALAIANQTPDDATALAAAQQQLSSAQQQKDMADAALKLLAARRAAIAEAVSKEGSNKNLAEIQLAANATESLLAIGRDLHTGALDPLADIEKAIAQLPAGHTKESLYVLVNKTRRELKAGEHALETLRKNLEDWFNESMDRIGGWYKRWSQKISLIFACTIVLACNVDSLQIAQRLMNDTALRASIVNAATVVANSGSNSSSSSSNNSNSNSNSVSNNNAASTPSSATDAASTSVVSSTSQTTSTTNAKVSISPEAQQNMISFVAQNANLPFGWDISKDAPKQAHANTSTFEDVKKTGMQFAAKILGLGISIFAISLGAPFWFDLLIKFVNLRASGKPPKKPEE
jgi:hypothetical protein